jgi:hypothetical protein
VAITRTPSGPDPSLASTTRSGSDDDHPIRHADSEDTFDAPDPSAPIVHTPSSAAATASRVPSGDQATSACTASGHVRIGVAASSHLNGYAGLRWRGS